MISNSYSSVSVFVVSTVNVSAQELSSTLHTTITGVPVAFEGEIVSFTCETRNSGNLAWSSNDYIGTGGNRLELIAADPQGTSRTVQTGLANATLIRVDQSVPILVSELHVRVVARYQTSSVTCHNIGTDETSNITFYVAGMQALCNCIFLHPHIVCVWCINVILCV